jgi:RNA polymerase sigma-70 factor (ECF subfamily)
MSLAVSEPHVATRAEAPSAPALTLDGVYRAHAAQVARWAAHMGGPGIDVEDVVHEVFMVVQRRLPEFRGEARLSTWLYRITERVVRDGRRKERVRAWLRRTRRNDVERALTDVLRTPAEQLEREQARASVYVVLDRLPEKYRRVLVLFEMEGLSGEQIAELTGVKLATVWVHLHRAREQFLTELARREGRP